MISNSPGLQAKKLMWNNRDNLARKALAKALAARSIQNIELTDAVAIYDAAERLGIDEVRFVDVPSLEELYFRNQRKILISSHRPSGRQAFNCAHGLGHHLFGHGMCVTAINDGQRYSSDFNPHEFLANTFAGFFLMPKTAICHGFACRGWDVKTPTPFQVYAIASWLGVGYTTLIHHMCVALRLINSTYADRLRRVSLSTIRMHVIGVGSNQNLVMVDRHWSGRAVDAVMDDVVVISNDFSTIGEGLEGVRDCRYGVIYLPTEPGCGTRLLNIRSGEYLAVRIAHSSYRGRNF
jgi:Zn-dependent peptidase ImmA (M78 family)